MIKKSAIVPLQYDTNFSPFYAKEFDEALEWLKNNDFDGIEIAISEPGKVNVEELNKKLNNYNLGVSTISTGQATVLEGISLTDEKEEIREEAVNRIKEHIDLSAQIGYPPVTIGLIRGQGSLDKKQEQLCFLKESLEKCIQYSIRKGVKLSLEPINKYESILINSCEEVLEFLKEMGDPENLGVSYDTFHSNIEDRDMLEAIKKLGEKLYHVHLADSNRRLPGEGHIDFKSIYDLLCKMNYSGYVSAEVLNLPDREHIKNHVYASITKITPRYFG